MKKRYTFHVVLLFVSVLLVQNSLAQDNTPFSLDEGRITLRGHTAGVYSVSVYDHYDVNFEPAQWLAMMWPRLELLRDLLAEDGSIWVSIDDNEAHYLKVIMDEVFGRRNFVANVFWQKTHTRENRTDVSAVHDHIILFARDREVWKEIRNVLPASESQLERFTNPDNDLRGS